MKLGLLLISFVLVSCNGGGGGGSSSSLSSDSLIGSWSNCENDSASPATSYKSNMTFTDDSATLEFISYTDLDCDPAKKDSTEITTYNFSVSSNILTTDVQTFSISIHKQSSAINLDLDFANGSSFCGFNNWSLNLSKDVTNLDCGGYVVNYGDTDSGAIAITNNQLILGNLTYQKVE